MVGCIGRKPMARTYRVSFFKRLADSTGHSVEACQGSVEIAATSRPRAIAAARRKFAQAGRVGLWSLRADYDRIERLPARSKPPSRDVSPRRCVDHHATA